MKKLLVVIDYQNDFVDGALANPAAVPLESGIAARVEAYLTAGDCVLFTQDTHTDAYPSTREGIFLPVPHCIKGTPGWHLYGALAHYEAALPENAALLEKPTFGAQTLPQAAEQLCGGAPAAIELCGVVTDICVVSNAIVLHTAFLDAPITVRGDLCAGTTREAHNSALGVLRGMGYAIVE